MPRPKKQSTCHPDRPHRANGLCQTCYNKWYEEHHPEMVKKHRQRNKERYKEHYREQSKLYYTKNKEQIKKRVRRHEMMKDYGITPEEYDILLYEQGGACAICGSEVSGRKRTNLLHVDHSHTTRKVRGLLCVLCNVGLGSFQDSPELLEAAARYLRDSS